MKFRKKVGETGLSLIEVMIAGAIMMTVMLAFMEQHNMQLKMIATSEAGFETIDVINQLRQTLSVPEACAKTFGGLLVSPTQVPVNQIWRAYKDLSNTWHYSVALTAMAYYNPIVRFNSFTLAGPNPSDGTGTLEVDVERIKKGVLGSAIVKRQIPLTLTVDATNHLLSCSTSGAGANDYITKTELKNMRPSGEFPIHRSWLTPPWFDENAGAVSPNNPPSRGASTNVCAATTPLWTYNVPAVTYDRDISAQAFIFVISDSNGSQDDLVELTMDINGSIKEKQIAAVDHWAGAVATLSGIEHQPANTTMVIKLTGRALINGCSIVDKGRIHMWVREI